MTRNTGAIVGIFLTILCCYGTYYFFKSGKKLFGFLLVIPTIYLLVVTFLDTHIIGECSPSFINWFRYGKCNDDKDKVYIKKT